MKTRINQLFLYRHRFILGYIFLSLTFAIILILLPSLSPGGISQAEMQSAVDSMNLSPALGFSNDFTNFIYKALQHLSISLFGLSLYSIKLPSIILGFFTGALIILLLNRWFKNNVALVASSITVLSPLFLFLAGSGTPSILYIFWPTLILWLGSKIIGTKHHNPLIFALLILSIASSIYTPHFIYVALLVLASVIIHPHIRFTVKTLRPPQIITGVSIALIVSVPLVVSCIINPPLIIDLACTQSDIPYAESIAAAFAPFFSFGSAIESIYLSPLFGLATIALAVIGAISSTGKMFTSRNTLVSLLVIFSIFMSGINQNAAILIFIPISILVATAIELILGKWYVLFPENPYARVFGIIPIATFTALIISSGFFYTVFGYHYAPAVVRHFNNDISLLRKNLQANNFIYTTPRTLEYDFYKILEREKSLNIRTGNELPSDEDITIFTIAEQLDDARFNIERIITSPKQQNSDRLYIYSN